MLALGGLDVGKESAYREYNGVGNYSGCVIECDVHRVSVESDPYFARLKVYVDVGTSPVDSGSGSRKSGGEVACDFFDAPSRLGLFAVVLLHALVNVTVHGDEVAGDQDCDVCGVLARGNADAVALTPAERVMRLGCAGGRGRRSARRGGAVGRRGE